MMASPLVNLILLKVADAWHRRTLLAKIIGFASIGVLNVAVDVTIFAIAFQFLRLPLIPSNVISWLFAITSSYAMNTKFTFGKETGGVLSARRYLHFAASGIVGAIIATGVLVLLAPFAGIPIAKLTSVIAAFVLNFSMSHFIVFRGRKIDSAHALLAAANSERLKK